MGHCRPKRHHHHHPPKSQTLPSSPTHSSSSSDFEFTISASPRKSSSAATADELFYKGQLLPLHLSPRLTMVRSLLLSSASTSSYSDTTTTTSTSTSRASTASSADDRLSSGRPSSVADDELKRLTRAPKPPPSKYFSLPKLFRKEQRNLPPPPPSGGGAAAAKRARDVIRRYLKKVKPFYEKLSQKQRTPSPPPPPRIFRSPDNPLSDRKNQEPSRPNKSAMHSFSGNLRFYYPKRSRSCTISSCPSSMGSSPSHVRNGLSQTGRAGIQSSDASSMEEVQDAIRGAIAHCKNSLLLQSKTEFSLIN